MREQSITGVASRLLFPTVLHGTHSTTQKAFRKLALEVINNESWDDSLAKLEWVPVGELPGEIIINGDSRDILRADEKHWRVFWAGWLRHYLFTRRKTASYESNNRLSRDLVLSGLQQAWFTMGFLLVDDAMRPTAAGDADLTECIIPILRQYVRWLPEIEALSPRIGLYSARSADVHGLFGYIWLGNLLHYARRLGYAVPWYEQPGDLEREVEANYFGSPISYLNGIGIIRQHGDRCDLCDPPPSNESSCGK
jgi:hypothetical protein